MGNLRKTLISTAAGLGALALAPSAAFAQGMMGQDQSMGPGTQMPGPSGQGMGMGPGMMSPGMQQTPGTPGQSMMGPEMMRMMAQMMNMMHGQSMPGSGMMGPGMMGGGQGMGPGMMQGMPGMGMMGEPGPGVRVTPSQHLTTDDVSHFLQHWVERQGNPRLKVGKVEQVDDDTIVAEVVTVDDSLVQRFKVDRHTGQIVPDNADQAQQVH
jgi:hypothetical protein